jgi:RND superfamily putative drug exporter
VELVAAGLDRLLPSVDLRNRCPKVDLGDLVIIPDDISALVAPNADLRMVVKNRPAARPGARCHHVADPLAFGGCGSGDLAGTRAGRRRCRRPAPAGGSGRASGNPPSAGRCGPTASAGRPGRGRSIPVTIWRGGCRLALDALEASHGHHRHRVERLSPVETTNVQLPTGDRLQIPTGAETLRLKSYLIMCRNSRSDYAEFADLVDCMDTPTAAVVLAGIDRYYGSRESERQWWRPNWCAGSPIETHRRRRRRRPLDRAEAADEWERIRQRCLAVAVAILEEAR